MSTRSLEVPTAPAAITSESKPEASKTGEARATSPAVLVLSMPSAAVVPIHFQWTVPSVMSEG